MLSGEMKKYEETYYSSGTTYGTNNYNNLSIADKNIYEGRFENAVREARAVLNVGDKIMLANDSPQVKSIVAFIDKPEESITYMGEICVILARDSIYAAQTPMKYSLQELDLNRIVERAKVDEPVNGQVAALLMQRSSNDE